jgi:DNA-binding transcriptional LysR family regulator
LDVHILQVFSSVYRNKSFSRASEELNLTQPTVSEHIKNLEDELGVKLFDRVGRQVIPTREADHLHTQAVEIIQKMRGLKTDIGRLKGEIKGLLTIGASATPGAYIVPPLAAEFRKNYPEVFFQLVIEESGQITDKVVSGELLLGIVTEEIGHKAIERLAEIEDDLVLAASKGFVKKKEITPPELLRMPFLMWSEGSEMYKTMEKGHSARGVSLRGLNVVAMLGSTDSVREAVKSGLGVSILSRFSVKDDLRAGSIEEVKMKGVHMLQSYYVIAHAKRSLSAEYRAFVDFLKNKFSG